MKRSPIRWVEPRFVCDVHLAKVARYLRLLGFDAVWRRDMSDDAIVGFCRMGRIALTCDRKLWERCREGIVLLRSTVPEEQLADVVVRFDLGRFAHPFSRSLCCNRPMAACDKRRCFRRIPKATYRWRQGFWRCTKCGKIYWQGTHAKRMRRKIVQLLDIGKTC